MTETKDGLQRLPVGFAPHLISPPKRIAPEERVRRSREMLCRVLSLETTVAFVGAGCSVPLGYPTWGTLATGLIERTREYVEAHNLEGSKKLVKSLRTSKPEEKMFAFSACREILCEKDYQVFFEDQFLRPPSKEPSPPLTALLKLPIYRFVTTNYDHEIERALTTERFIPCAEFGLRPVPGKEFGFYPLHDKDCGRPAPLPKRPRSFTQRSENCDQLALFALAEVEEARNLVFHCHGRIDDFESILATEADYQRWYLADRNGEGRVFRQTIDLLLDSNPILFVGYGLGDEDLLRPLRLFNAICPQERFERPLFALMESESESDRIHHEYYFERYGLNVLPFPADPTKTKEQRLQHALEDLAQDLTLWRRSWIEKPCFRKLTFTTSPPHPYRNPGPIPDMGEPSARENKDTAELLGCCALASLQELVEIRGKDPRILVLLGESGMGKSWRALQLFENLESPRKKPPLPDPNFHSLNPNHLDTLEYIFSRTLFEGYFFWSSYYSDDLLSGVERLLHYLDPEAQTASMGSRLDRLEALLHGWESKPEPARCLIVIDGFDRLLRRTGLPGEGRIENHAARKFVDLFLSNKCESKLLLTSQLWPRELNGCSCTARISIKPLQFRDSKQSEFFGTSDADTKILYALLEGHAYALLLAKKFLKRESMRRLEEVLFGCAPEKRIWRLIQEIITGLDEDKKQSFALPLLERLAVFMAPVTSQIRGVCYDDMKEEMKKAHPGIDVPGVEEIVAKLVASSLLSSDTCGPSTCDTADRVPIWTVPPTVRRYVFERVHQVSRDALPHFALSGFTSGDASVHPGSAKGAKIVKSLWEKLSAKTEEAIHDKDSKKAGEFCRALFGVMRARMEANTTPRWWTYKEYARYCVRLIDLIRRASSLANPAPLTDPFWTYCEPHAFARIEWEKAPLHADELAWLYNEAGLTFLACGHMADCLRVWEQGYEINRIIDGTTPVPIYTLQSQLHLVHATLDLGRLREMRHYLDEAEKTNAKVEDDDARGRILGFRALLAHLQNNFDEADRLYEEAIQDLGASRNARAGSYFQSHRAALKVSLGHFDAADEAVTSCLALAEAAGYPDLVVYSRLACAQVCRARGHLVEATITLNTALREAERLHLGRLQAEILTELARLALDLGDSALARQRALEALEISNSHSLGLRRSHSLLVLGLATVKAEQRKLGITYLKQAQDMAESQEYWLCRHEAAERLEALGATDGPGDRSELPLD